MKKIVLLAVLAAGSVQAAEEINVYSARQAYLIEPIVKEFEKDQGIKVNLVYAEDGLAERLAREGKHTPADLVLTVDISRLTDLVDKGLVQPVWFALTTRVRNIYTSKDRIGKPADITYESLADPKYKGKICTRSGKNSYNVALVASMIAHHGEAKTHSWLEGVKANLARKPQGNDRDQVKAIKEGICDLSLGNSYYLGKMLQDEEQKTWADAVYINFPNQQDRGAHVNVSGVLMTKYAKNKAAALKLMEYLSADKAQQMYAELNMEYPVKAGVAPSKLVASWGEFKADALPIAKIATYRKQAITLLDDVKFDL